MKHGYGLGEEADGYCLEGHGLAVDLNPIKLKDLNPISI